MLNSITNNAAYFAAKAQAAVKTGYAAPLSSPNEPVSAADTALGKIREAIALAILKADKGQGAATLAAEIDEARRESEEFVRVNTFESGYDVRIGEDASSTPEKPIMYVETEEDGETSAWLVDIDAIDPASMTKAEALALMQYLSKSEGWIDLSYADMLAAISALFGKGSPSVPGTTSVIHNIDRLGQYYKPTFTYTKDARHNFSGTSITTFEQTRELREAQRAMRIRNLLERIQTDSAGKKTLADVYL
jgi:hypothetical protein